MIVTRIHSYYGGLEGFSKAYDKLKYRKATTRDVARFSVNFNMTKDTYRKILGYAPNKDGLLRYVSLGSVFNMLPKWLHLRKNFTDNKGKNRKRAFGHKSYWYIDFDQLKAFLAMNEVLCASSSYYTKSQHLFID